MTQRIVLITGASDGIGAAPPPAHAAHRARGRRTGRAPPPHPGGGRGDHRR